MKRLNIFFYAALLLCACNTQSSTDNSAEEIHFPYSINHPDDYWEKGDSKNILVVLNFFKEFEKGNLSAAMTSFADSVQWTYDYFDQKLSRDELKARLNYFRSTVNKVEIKMKEWKSVTSSETAQEFVLVWYTQFWENNCGSVDSVFKMDNIELEDGKILSLDEEFRRLPKAN